MSDHTAKIQELESWEAQSMRLTLFPVVPVDASKMNWWEQVVGLPPDRSASLRKVGGYEEAGTVKQHALSLRVLQTRIDWNFDPVSKVDLSGDDIPTIGAFPDAMQDFMALMHKWFGTPSFPAASRMAFGAVLLKHMNDKTTGYQELARLLLPSVQVDPVNSSDFTYSINRPRMSLAGIEGLRINRLSKWSVMVWGWMQHSIAGTATERRKTGPEHYSCHLELDISTGQDFLGDIPASKIPMVWEELVSMGTEIAEQGDIP